MLDRITGMQIFTRVASSGSLSAAARSLAISQTLATKHIAALEQQLDIKLFLRSTRGLKLTAAGERYLAGVTRVLRDIEALEEDAAADDAAVRGLLRLNAPASFGHRILAPLLAGFSQRYPGLNIDLSLDDKRVDLVEEGWDLVIRIGKLKSNTLRARRLAPCELVVCAAPSYLERRGVPATIEELINHNCIGYTLSEHLGPRRWTFGAQGERSVPIHATLSINNGDAIVAAALEGYGIIYKPLFMVHQHLQDGRLVALQLNHPPLGLHDVFAVFQGARKPPEKVRVLIDFLLEQLQAPLPWISGRPALVSGRWPT
ncbi:LysR family transcriptional regulator [Pseudomonas gingeri]